MTYYRKLCDETIILKSKHKHLKSRKHKYLEGFLLMRHIVENPDMTQLNQIMRKYIRIL